MTKTIANNVQSDFIFAFEEFILEIFLSLGIKKSKLEAEIVGLSREINFVISEKQILKILEKLKLFYKLEEKFIAFCCDDDEELSWNFEGPAVCYA